MDLMLALFIYTCRGTLKPHFYAALLPRRFLLPFPRRASVAAESLCAEAGAEALAATVSLVPEVSMLKGGTANAGRLEGVS